ncbi:Chaperonin Cpn10 [Penicillium mononematosum]|uniref:Chaperonin Cpn10 n=1 Tax=Penicillium mononematosum TaxID=268346 RepID=UPI00254865D9|nr:Chaperonin Cpn10 [Penicillium mononematosum]KAJ6183856.1 Chaperonin Cpn10 [Penicillium mononematosum]
MVRSWHSGNFSSPDLLPPDQFHLLPFPSPSSTHDPHRNHPSPSQCLSSATSSPSPPLLDRVLVQRIKPEAKTASGIFLPEAAVKEQNEAQVLAVGPGLLDRDGKRIPMGVNAGDKVLIPQFGGNAIKVGEEEYTLFRDHDILAKIKE